MGLHFSGWLINVVDCEPFELVIHSSFAPSQAALPSAPAMRVPHTQVRKRSSAATNGGHFFTATTRRPARTVNNSQAVETRAEAIASICGLAPRRSSERKTTPSATVNTPAQMTTNFWRSVRHSRCSMMYAASLSSVFCAADLLSAASDAWCSNVRTEARPPPRPRTRVDSAVSHHPDVTAPREPLSFKRCSAFLFSSISASRTSSTCFAMRPQRGSGVRHSATLSSWFSEEDYRCLKVLSALRILRETRSASPSIRVKTVEVASC